MTWHLPSNQWNGRGVALVEPGPDTPADSCDKGLAINPDFAIRVLSEVPRTWYSMIAYGSPCIF
jgi:hypothetical protein